MFGGQSTLLLFKDAPFSTPILSRFVSDGTLKLLSYLTVLYDPSPPKLIGIEEPENYLHPKLLPELAEECQQAAERAQLIVTTHSPFFLRPLSPDEVRILFRGDDGYTQSRRIADMKSLQPFLAAGATLSDLWIEGYFETQNLSFDGARIMALIEILVEEPSAEEALKHILPKLLPTQHKANIRNLQSKYNLLKVIEERLRAYAQQINSGDDISGRPSCWTETRIIVSN